MPKTVVYAAGMCCKKSTCYNIMYVNWFGWMNQVTFELLVNFVEKLEQYLEIKSYKSSVIFSQA